MKSMTGFGRGTASAVSVGLTFTVEISSINRKQSDIRVSLPPEMAGFEPMLRQLVNERISRGALGVRVISRAEGAAAAVVQLNSAVLQELIKETITLQRNLGLPEKVELRDFFVLPGVVENIVPDLDRPEIVEALTTAAVKAIEALQTMKNEEGNNLKADIAARLQTLRTTVDRVEPLVSAIPQMQKERLLQRLTESGLNIDLNDERVMRELVIFSDKSDVTEELTRLRSHFDQFDVYMRNGTNEPVGRSLDFLVQEIFRELTTLGNKAGTAEVSPLVVKMKTEVEKIREQIQNVE